MGAERAIVEVLGREGTATGLGFVVDDSAVVTCAHVINAALGRELRDATVLEAASVTLRFIYAPGQPTAVADVARWAPTPTEPFDEADLAGLVLRTPLPAGTKPAGLAPDRDLARRSRVKLYGPVGRDGGGIVPAEIAGLLPNGRIQLNQEVVGTFRALPGFSGGPAWTDDDRGLVAGMLVAVASSEAARDVYILGVDRIVAFWSERVRPAAGAGDHLEETFLQALRDAPDLSVMPVPPIGSVALEHLFVPPFVVRYGSEIPVGTDELETAVDAVRRLQRVVIMAGPGLGKSTLLRHLTRELAASSTGPPTYPILVSLPAYVTHLGDLDLLAFGVRDRYDTILTRDELDGLTDLARSWNREGRLLFLLDGLDEVTGDRRRLLLDEIARLRRFVVASRPVTRLPLSQERDATLQLCPLSPASIAEYVLRWERAGLAGYHFSASRLLERLRTDQRLGDLARIPQLLGLVCWSMGNHPDDRRFSRTDLLSQAVSELIRSAVERSGVPPDEAERLPLRLRATLRQLAFDRLESTDDASGRFSREELVEWADRFAGTEEAVRLIRLARSSGLIVPTPGHDDDLQFVHPVFQELLAAEALVRAPDLGAAVDRIKHQRDCELSLRMACEILDSSRDDDRARLIIERLIAEPDIFGFSWCLAARCAGAIQNADDRLGPCVADIARTIFSGASTWWSRHVFADAIGELRTSSMRAVLLDALDNEDRYARWAAAAGLGAMADPSTVDAILLALQTEQWPPIRASLVHAAGRIGDRRVLPTLGELIDDADDGWTRDALGVALGRLEAVEILEALLDRDLDTVHSLVTAAMQYLPSRSADALKQRLAEAGYSVRYDPEDPFAAQGPTLAELDGLLESPDPREWMRAIDALEWRADWPALERLLDLLIADDEDVAQAAARAIPTMGEDHNALVEAIRFLTATMADVANENREAAGVALVQLWLNEQARDAVDESVGRYFEDLLDEAQFAELERFLHGDTIGSAAAAWVLAYSSSGGAALAQAIGAGTGIGRWMAVWGVSRQGDPAVVPDLLARLADEDSIEVRTAIAHALGELGASTAETALTELLSDDAPATRAAAATALGQLDDPAIIGSLLDVLDDDDPEVRRAAATAIGRLNVSDLVAPLVQRLAGEDDAGVAIAIVEALSGRDHPDVLVELQRRLDDGTPEVRTAAALALGETGSASSAPALVARLDVETVRQVVEETAYAVGRVADRSTLLSTAERLISDNLNPLAHLAMGAARRDDRPLVSELIEHLRSRGVTAIVARHAVEIERGDYVARQTEPRYGAIDGDSPKWLDRWEAVRLWAARADEEAVAAIAARLLDEDGRVVRVAAHSLKQVFDDGWLSEIVWDAIGEAVRTALGCGTFDRMTTHLYTNGGGPTEHWVLARPDLLCELLRSYLDGREALRPVLWEIGDRYGLRLLGDGRVIMPAGDIVACDVAVGRLLQASIR